MADTPQKKNAQWKGWSPEVQQDDVAIRDHVTPQGALLPGAAESGAAVTPLPERGRWGSSLARRTWRARDRNAGNQWRKTTDETSDKGKPADTHDTTHHGVTPPPRYEPGEVACIEASMLCV